MWRKCHSSAYDTSPCKLFHVELEEAAIEGKRAGLPGVNTNLNKTGANRRPQSGANRCPPSKKSHSGFTQQNSSQMQLLSV